MALHLGLTGIKATFASLSTTAKVAAIVTTITITEATVFIAVKTINEQLTSPEALGIEGLGDVDQVEQAVGADTVVQADSQLPPTPVVIDKNTETVTAPDAGATKTDTDIIEPESDDDGVTEPDKTVDIEPIPEKSLIDMVTIPDHTEGMSSYNPEN